LSRASLQMPPVEACGQEEAFWSVAPVFRFNTDDRPYYGQCTTLAWPLLLVRKRLRLPEFVAFGIVMACFVGVKREYRCVSDLKGLFLRATRLSLRWIVQGCSAQGRFRRAWALPPHIKRAPFQLPSAIFVTSDISVYPPALV